MEPQTIDLLFAGLLWLGVIRMETLSKGTDMSKWNALRLKINEQGKH